MLRKRIINLSINCRKLIFATELKPIGSLCQVRSATDYVKLLSNIDYENPKFQYKLFDSANSSIVLDLLKLNFNDPNLNSSDTIGALMKFVHLCKQENLPPDQVVHEDFFTNLCALIDSQASSLNLSEAIQILDLLCELRVHSSSESILHLLDRTDELVNAASFGDYNRIMQIVEKMSSPRTQEIKTRLIKKFILKISTEFDEHNFEFLVEAFRFACRYIHDKKIVKMIIDPLQNNDFDKQSPRSILSLMETLNSLKLYSAEWDEILLKAQNAFSVNIRHIENKDISNTLKKASVRMNENRLDQFYNKTLFDKAIQKLTSTECSLRDGLLCLEASITARHTSKELLNYLSGQVYVEKEIDGKHINDEVFFTMLEGCVDLKYKPLCWDMFINFFKSDEILNYNKQRLIYRAYHLACLGCYELKILEKIFESDFDFGPRRFMHHNFLRLYQVLKTMPNYAGPFPSRRQLKSFETLIRENIGYPFYTSLMEGLGGPEYVKTNVRTKLFHQIDHVIAFESDGKPVAINNNMKEENTRSSDGSIEYLEDLIVPENSQVIAVMSVPKPWYARNTNKILGKYSTYFETLETLSCRVVTVGGMEWQTLPKESRTAFLMDNIRKKLENEER